jgi:leucyl aminopeptidase
MLLIEYKINYKNENAYIINPDIPHSLNAKNSRKILNTLSNKYKLELDNIDNTIFIIALPDSIINNEQLQYIIWTFIKLFTTWKYKTDLHIIITTQKECNKIYEIVKIATNIQHARMMAILPANLAYPSELVKHFKDIFSKIPSVKLIEKNYKQLKKEGFNLLLSVGNGSSIEHKPSMLIIQRKTKIKNSKTICIIGKGITFDSGGLDIKRRNSMDNMKFDKIGAIYAAYSLLYLLQDKSLNKYNFIGILPFAENVISDTSTRPGDVIKSYSGKTVEILDTDAEGRLILADALSYACKKYKPDTIIDIATLTGFADIISCMHSAYIFSESNKMRNLAESISFKLGERMISMPSWSDNSNDILKSDIADLVNVPRKNCNDSYIAALFLREFILPHKCDWLHIDLANEINDNIPEGQGIQTIIEIINNLY